MNRVFYAPAPVRAASAMSPRASLLLTSTLLAIAVLVRAFPFVWWPGTHFDSDQAVVGLMAKHVSEGRAFPLFYYGQSYMLAVEAYAAAPIMLALGATVTALKLPLVAINVATVVLLVQLLVRDARLPPLVAAIAALPLALPAAGIAARVTEANGGNVEPWFYILLLWWWRDRPWLFGATLGFGMLHREFTAYGAVALLVMDLLSWRLWHRLPHWALAFTAFVATRVVASSLQPFASGLGPGTRGDAAGLVMASIDTVGGRLCFAPETWPARLAALWGDHLPRVVGSHGAPLREYGVLTTVYSGQPGIGLWVGSLTIVGLASGSWYWWQRRQSRSDENLPHLAGYLLLVGVISTLVYGFATCSNIRVETLRYNLLAVFVPVGAITMALQTWRAPAARAGFGAAVGLWCALNLLDVLALTREYVERPPVDGRRAVADALVDNGVTSAWSAFRNAYHITFLAQERVRVSANDFVRIQSYADEATATGAPTIADGPCAGGEALPSGQFLCPAEPAGR